MLENLNKVLSMGWRFADVDLPGHLTLVPPEEESGPLLTTGFNNFQLIIPTEKLEAWLLARDVVIPDDGHRRKLQSRVKAWVNARWHDTLRECDGDEEYTREILIQDVLVVFNVDATTAREWV